MSTFISQMAVTELRRQIKIIDCVLDAAAADVDPSAAVTRITEQLRQVRAQIRSVANNLDAQS